MLVSSSTARDSKLQIPGIQKKTKIAEKQTNGKRLERAIEGGLDAEKEAVA